MIECRLGVKTGLIISTDTSVVHPTFTLYNLGNSSTGKCKSSLLRVPI